jgi:Tfp pilus assembly protein PilV
MRLVRPELTGDREHRLPSLCAKQALSLFRFSRLKARWAHRRARLCSKAFALYEVMIGVFIFAIGIISLGRAVSNCMNASAFSADDARVREILANRMVEIETTPGQPDKAKESKIDTGFGTVKMVQKAVPQEMKEEDGTQLTGIIRVTLTANWSRGGADQSKQIAFYVYRF